MKLLCVAEKAHWPLCSLRTSHSNHDEALEAEIRRGLSRQARTVLYGRATPAK